MKCDVELISGGSSGLLVTKKLSEILGCGLSSAKIYLNDTPCAILENVDMDYATNVCKILQDAGATTNIIQKAEEQQYITETLMSSENPVLYSEDRGDRAKLVGLWCKYTEYNNTVEAINEKIKSNKKEISNLEKEISKKQIEIDRNKKIKQTGGECLRPSVKKISMVEFPEFEIIKWLFVAVAIISFIILLIMVGVASDAVEVLADSINMPAGVMVWLGGPLIGIIAVFLFSIGYMIKNAIEAVSYNKAQIYKHNNYDVTKARNEANAYLNNLEVHNAEIRQKEKRIQENKEQINNLELCKNDLPIVQNKLAMPDELRSAEGIALLIRYIDTGRADTIKECINLYCQDLKDSVRMAELKKQTQYAQEQMLNSREAAELSRIAAENTRRTLEETSRAADAAERAADAAETAARYEMASYWENVINNKS